MSLVEETPRYELGESYGPSLRLSQLLTAGDDDTSLNELTLGYGSIQGDALLRDAIARKHGVHPDDVVVTVGGIHALFLCAFILCREGDEAVIAAPIFPPARATLEAVGANLSALFWRFDDGYQPNIPEFRNKLSARTRLVSIASPQNPSGVSLSENTLRQMLATMSAVCPDAYLLLDETYREAAYRDNQIPDSACNLSPRIISIASLSKFHGAPGLRIGWAIARDSDVREQLVLGKFNSVISCSPLDEALAVRVLEQPDRLVKERRAHFDAALRSTAAWVHRNDRYVEWVRPDAGALCCIRLNSATFDDAGVQRFYDETAREGVRVANGSWFGDEARVFRLGFGLLSSPELDAALAALTSALERAAAVTA